ncbi:uncharacterized protein SPPG_08928 [Spizellomyces punctatus DAOM BR117]|uniref:Uncharacterized protein n=1 Tax=Spizellomyces punctatus (strain DAOM BR117) TaxID=645134 RepID=A0A0L0HS18_SPIPD|nr:uncharacterized protein SPPG_08928 [Spizellomyces punctatus DAOM BR117]KND03918.1 hypothetical protein SPPG_08928 [Spizellomyces punctatus DAOM BR117]|eukprot:XP_016611957.1 hypothetical protein SPPG_08928 [Spizellomyces punctatus DAOM BR117]
MPKMSKQRSRNLFTKAIAAATSQIPNEQQRNSHRHNNFTLEKNTFRYDLSLDLDNKNDGAKSMSVKSEVAPSAEERNEADENPDKGFEDSIFLPFDFDVNKCYHKLVQIATEVGIMVSHDFDSNTLRLCADDVESLSHGRGLINSLVYNPERPIKSKTVRKFAKAERPGEWGEPRENSARPGSYKMLGKYGEY